jgi:signal transduction histidine kinase
MRRIGGNAIGYSLVLLASFTLATIAGWLGAPIDNYAYDWMFRRRQPPPRAPESIVLGIDEASLSAFGGMRHLRRMIGLALERVAAAGPRVVAIDLLFADRPDPAEDALLASALAKIPKLVLACEVIGEGAWEDPIGEFRRYADALGHVHGEPGPLDGVSRRVPLEQVAARERRWALALEAFRLSRGAARVLESPRDIQVGGVRVPAARADFRSMFIRYLPPAEDGATLPRISVRQVIENPGIAENFRGKVVFVGLTAQAAMRDRMLTPYSSGSYMPGVEIHANIFETLARGEFLVRAPEWVVLLASLGIAAVAVLAFALLGGWQAYALAGLVLAGAHTLPYVLFARHVVFPYFAPVSAAWLSAVGAGAFHFFVVRRQLGRSQTETQRYRQAMHFVTHEMRTPLTAIQGSSELMQRYKLTEEKRRQIADLIHSESRRLARMIETFLNVERLSAGQMELKREVFPASDLVSLCVERARPLAERKQIRIRLQPVGDAVLTGDRELIEYAVYNLLTNAVKYSPADTEVTVAGRHQGTHLRLWVADQGIGMNKHELRQIFRKFYRTRRAEASGEAGTGIGLSIVEQIITQHGGTIEVESAPGKGSCFTLVLPAARPECAAAAEMNTRG